MTVARRIKEAAASLGGPSAFRNTDCSLSDFLGNVLDDADDEFTAAAKVIMYLCVEDGEFNNFQTGLALAMTFLGRNASATLDPSRAVRDLRGIVDDGLNHAALEGWARSHYG